MEFEENIRARAEEVLLYIIPKAKHLMTANQYENAIDALMSIGDVAQPNNLRDLLDLTYNLRGEDEKVYFNMHFSKDFKDGFSHCVDVVEELAYKYVNETKEE